MTWNGGSRTLEGGEKERGKRGSLIKAEKKGVIAISHLNNDQTRKPWRNPIDDAAAVLAQGAREKKKIFKRRRLHRWIHPDELKN